MKAIQLEAPEKFTQIEIDVVTKSSPIGRPEDAATGLVQGNPVAIAITERDPALLPVITDAVAKAIRDQFGETGSASMQAIVGEARTDGQNWSCYFRSNWARIAEMLTSAGIMPVSV